MDWAVQAIKWLDVAKNTLGFATGQLKFTYRFRFQKTYHT
ncbi:hypothetical protein Rcae01_02337 [Novipirellula caenicola]|uniref:Uncharacterized protein n=1 Tax=Novipirellula caenicola TaxID=1536901 RepID=A0ABP9VNX4_9BACT